MISGQGRGKRSEQSRGASRVQMRTHHRRQSRRRQVILLALAVLTAAIFVFLLRGFGSSGTEAKPDGAGESPAVSDTSTGPAPEGGTDAEATQPPAFQTLAMPAGTPDPARVVKLPTLMFHHVGDTPPGADETRTGLTVSAAEFESMMAYLAQAGYHTVSERQLFRALFYGEALPSQPVMLTFDDGYADNFSVAAPILEKHGLVATFYVVTDQIGSGEYMSWDQVTQLDRRGMDIGSHTASHPDLTQLSAADLKHELGDSGAAITAHIGHPIYWLSYPAGSYDDDVLRYTRQAGYLLAVTTEPGEKQSSDSPLAVMRYRVRNDTGLEGFKELVR